MGNSTPTRDPKARDESHLGDDGIEIRQLVDGDAEGLVACFRRCYGDSYPVIDFYSARRLGERIREGSLRSVVAIEAGGRLVGHTGLSVRATTRLTDGRGGPAPASETPGPFDGARRGSAPRAAIAGNTVVDPDVRGRRILGRMGAALADLTRREGFVGYVHFPTTAHTIMQHRSVRQGGVETGVLLAYLPAETEYLEIERPRGRLAATVVYQPFETAPARGVVLPDRYRGLLLQMYREAGLDREVTEGAGRSDSATRLQLHRDSRRGVLRIDVHQVGDDFAEHFAGQVGEESEPVDPVTLVDLPLDEPRIDAAVEVLRRAGFLFCALLPELAHTDLLRMQRLSSPGALEASLANPGARRLQDLMRREQGEESR